MVSFCVSKQSGTIRATISDHPYCEIKLVINHKTDDFHVLFYQLNALVKLLANAITPKFSIWMMCSGTFDAQIPPGGKIPDTDIILGWGLFMLVLWGSLVSGGHISKYFMLWSDPVLSQCDSGFRWSCIIHEQFPKWMGDLICLVAFISLKCKFTNRGKHTGRLHLQLLKNVSAEHCATPKIQFCWNRVFLREHFNFEEIFYRKVSKWIISSFVSVW